MKLLSLVEHNVYHTFLLHTIGHIQLRPETAMIL